MSSILPWSKVVDRRRVWVREEAQERRHPPTVGREEATGKQGNLSK